MVVPLFRERIEGRYVLSEIRTKYLPLVFENLDRVLVYGANLFTY